MITPKQIEQVSMSPAKREEAKNKYFDFYIGRPISYVLTIPFLYTNISPNTVTYISFLFCLGGFACVVFGNSMWVQLLGCFLFFMWNMFDGIDGNIARYKKQFSPNGDLIDTMGGYLAMVCTFFAFGIAAFYDVNEPCYFGVGKDAFLILGCASAIFTMFPRLVLHKKLASTKDQAAREEMDNLRSKAKYGIGKLIVMNITSIAGIIQVIMTLAVIFHLMGLFTIVYFAINLVVMVASFYKILKD